MRIVCIGGGPVELCFDLLTKALDPSHRIPVIRPAAVAPTGAR
jgi:hypothetical protein